MGVTADIRDGIAEALNTITGLRAYDYVPAQAKAPFAFCSIESIDYDEALQRGLDRYLVGVYVYASVAQQDRTAQDAVDEYVEPTAGKSVKAALEADKTLGGRVDTVRVQSAGGPIPELLTHAETTYIGARWTVEIYARGD